VDGVEREAVRRVEEVLAGMGIRSCSVSERGRRRRGTGSSCDRRVLAERERPAAALDPDGGRVAPRVRELARQRGPDADDDLKERGGWEIFLKVSEVGGGGG